MRKTNETAGMKRVLTTVAMATLWLAVASNVGLAADPAPQALGVEAVEVEFGQEIVFGREIPFPDGRQELEPGLVQR